MAMISYVRQENYNATTPAIIDVFRSKLISQRAVIPNLHEALVPHGCGRFFFELLINSRPISATIQGVVFR